MACKRSGGFSRRGRSECGGARSLNLTLKFIDEYASSAISSEVFFLFKAMMPLSHFLKKVDKAIMVFFEI
ncbi:hypothetical protein BK133_02490 [Paenibacillus sp. FSL H8-0548]|nr:hypothetical protein BK133_02490 [Paenibacillus sp. FSL H8-0548]